MAFFAAKVVTSFVSGVACEYVFRRPPLDRTSFKMLGLGGLRGTATLIATMGLVSLYSSAAKTVSFNITKGEIVKLTMFSTAAGYIATAMTVHYFAKHPITHLATYLEILSSLVILPSAVGMLRILTFNN